LAEYVPGRQAVCVIFANPASFKKGCHALDSNVMVSGLYAMPDAGRLKFCHHDIP
jgi:hypothetical protein